MKTLLLSLSPLLLLGTTLLGAEPLPSGDQADGPFRKVVLTGDQQVSGAYADTLKDPMELALAKDGRVFLAEREGTVKLYKPETKTTVVIGKLEVFTTGGKNLEDGLLGITLDPNFQKNGWVYLNHSLPGTGLDAAGQKTGTNRISRFTLKGEALDMGSEKVILDIATQREQCCHTGGSMTFDNKGNLYISSGDNTNPFESDGFAPIDERPGRSPWDAQKSSANPNDLRGKILRVTPQKNGSYKIPKGNLFKPGTAGTRPEIYTMGHRNPFRISVDRKTGFVYAGDVGPDSGGRSETRGPAGHDEINQARKASNFGWPHFVGNNNAYTHWNFVTKTNEFAFDPLKPVNLSPNNTGLKELPAAQPAFIFYTHAPSTRFPAVNGSGGRTAMAGPVYYFDPKLKSAHKLPAEFDHTLFIYEWSRNWIVAVKLDKNDNIESMKRFCPNLTFKRPMDMELGADGCLYLIEWGTAWGNNKDTQVVRVEYNP